MRPPSVSTLASLCSRLLRGGGQIVAHGCPDAGDLVGHHARADARPVHHDARASTPRRGHSGGNGQAQNPDSRRPACCRCRNPSPGSRAPSGSPSGPPSARNRRDRRPPPPRGSRSAPRRSLPPAAGSCVSGHSPLACQGAGQGRDQRVGRHIDPLPGRRFADLFLADHAAAPRPVVGLARGGRRGRRVCGSRAGGSTGHRLLHGLPDQVLTLASSIIAISPDHCEWSFAHDRHRASKPV